MKALVLILAAGIATPALADPWMWRDDAGEEHWTDDPSAVPEERRHTLRRLGEETEEGDEGGWYTGLDTSDAPSDPEALRQAQRELQRRQALVRTLETLQAELATLERARIHLANEHRKYSAGGRIGAADRAAAALEKLRALDREIAGKRAELTRAEAGLAVLE